MMAANDVAWAVRWAIKRKRTSPGMMRIPPPTPNRPESPPAKTPMSSAGVLRRVTVLRRERTASSCPIAWSIDPVLACLQPARLLGESTPRGVETLHPERTGLGQNLSGLLDLFSGIRADGDGNTALPP